LLILAAARGRKCGSRSPRIESVPTQRSKEEIDRIDRKKYRAQGSKCSTTIYRSA
jgi:hypothetical protein